MSDVVRAVKATEVQVGDRIRVGELELTVDRIQHPFLGGMVYIAFIEDSDEKWLKLPVPVEADVEVLGG